MAISDVKARLQEARATARVLKSLPKILPSAKNGPAQMLDIRVRKTPNNLGMVFEGRKYTWREINDQANQYAAFLREQGIGKGDVVALMMDNRPEYFFFVMAMAKLGAISALINTNLTGEPLVHAISVAKAKKVFVGEEHLDAIDEVFSQLDELKKSDDLYVQFEGDKPRSRKGTAVNNLIAEQPTSEQWRQQFLNSDPYCYIYTSGTTGLPKAAIVTNQRMVAASAAFGRAMFEATPSDVIYVTLPMYHSSAMYIGTGSCLDTGATIALRRKFSASSFWDDVNEMGATGFLYIGELCRYLLNSNSHPGERTHKLRIGVGNGLRADVWTAFQERFGVPLFREFYGATEGNTILTNFQGVPGMIGRKRLGQLLLRCDEVTGEPVRNADGFCEEVDVGEAGLLVGRIQPWVRFDGYLDKNATQKKILKDVRKKGDRYFNTGDLIQLHEDNWLSFADRIGDTFRWKGENVSTNEVMEILGKYDHVLEANVYGVEVPNAEGRAGMAALNVEDGFDLQGFAKFARENLANYQLPYFVRILSNEMRITGTFKHQKVDYRKEGFDPSIVNDPLYFLDGDKYVEIDQKLMDRFNAGKISPA